MNLMKKDIAVRVSIITIIVNFLLFILKFLAGIISNSSAMVSDAIHTASDVFSTFIVIIGLKLSSKKEDKEHRYGHERIECIASILLSIILFITGLGLGVSFFEKLFVKDYDTLLIPGTLSLIASIISIITKEWMYWYTRKTALKINSVSMLADAWHHRSDALSSIGAFIGILGSQIGFPILDSLASVIIAIFICKTAIDIFMDSVNKLVDKSCDDNIISEMKNIINDQDDLLILDDIKTRIFGNKVYVDIEISLDGNMSLNLAHEIAHKVHDAIEFNFTNVKHCMVHVNPLNIKKSN